MAEPTQQAQPATDRPAALRTLGDIVEAGLAYLAEIDDAQGEVGDELGRKLDELADSLTAKAEAYKAVALALETEADACEHFAAPYLERAERKRASAARLKERLKLAMEMLGVPKALGITGGAAIQKNSTPELVVSVPNAELKQRVPAELLREVVELDRNEVKRRLQAGEKLTFASLKYGTHLRWR